MEAKSCNKNAERCIKVAQQCGDMRLQSILFDLARVWLELGITYEKRRGLTWLAVERNRRDAQSNFSGVTPQRPRASGA
jgi:hypothetical protein